MDDDDYLKNLPRHVNEDDYLTVPEAAARGEEMMHDAIRKSGDLGYLFRNGQRWTFFTVTVPAKQRRKPVDVTIVWTLVPEPFADS